MAWPKGVPRTPKTSEEPKTEEGLVQSSEYENLTSLKTTLKMEFWKQAWLSYCRRNTIDLEGAKKWADRAVHDFELTFWGPKPVENGAEPALNFNPMQLLQQMMTQMQQQGAPQPAVANPVTTATPLPPQPQVTARVPQGLPATTFPTEFPQSEEVVVQK